MIWCGGLPRMSTNFMFGTGFGVARLLILMRTYLPSLALHQLSTDGVADPSTTDIFQSTANHGEISCIVPDAVTLFVGIIVFFVDNDETEGPEGREKCGSCANSDLNLIGPDATPLHNLSDCFRPLCRPRRVVTKSCFHRPMRRG